MRRGTDTLRAGAWAHVCLLDRVPHAETTNTVRSESAMNNHQPVWLMSFLGGFVDFVGPRIDDGVLVEVKAPHADGTFAPWTTLCRQARLSNRFYVENC